MEVVNFLAQFWGWLLVLISLIYFFRGERLMSELVKLSLNKAFSSLTGYIALIIGLTSLLLYREWTFDKMVLVTIFGWLSLIKGVLRVGFPHVTHWTTQWVKGRSGFVYLLLSICLLLGAWLLWG